MKKLFLGLGLLLAVNLSAERISIKNNTNQTVEVARIKVILSGTNADDMIEVRKGSAHIRNIRPGRTGSINLDTATKRQRSTTERDPKKTQKWRKLAGSTRLSQGLKDPEITMIKKINAKFVSRCPNIKLGTCTETFKGVCCNKHDHGRLNIMKAPKDVSDKYEITMENGQVSIQPYPSSATTSRWERVLRTLKLR